MPASQPDPERPTIRVLLIDDDPVARREAVAILKADFEPIEIEEISDHVGFFQALKRPDFDLVITEQLLHWSSGEEVVNAVKSLKPTVPVIIATLVHDDEVAAAALKSGVAAYISRSADFAPQLISAIRSALRLIEYEDQVSSLQSQLNLMLERLNVGVFRSDLDGRLVEANTPFLSLIGFETLEEAQKLKMDGLYARSSDRTQLLKILHDEGQVSDFQFELKRADGTTIWASLTETIEKSDDGSVAFEGMIVDVTTAHQAQETLRQANRQYRTIFEANSAATLVVDEDMTISMVNSAFEALTGYSRQQVEDRMCWTELVSRADVEGARAQHRSCLEGGDEAPAKTEMSILDRDGKSLLVRATEALLPGTKRTVLSLLNLTERRQAEAQVLHAAFHDPVTELPNRIAVLDRLDNAYADKRPFTAIVVNVDRFKLLRDSVGHGVANELLRAIAERLQRSSGDSDAVASLGGDSFVVVVDRVAKAEDALPIAATLKDVCAKPFSAGKHRLFTSVSIGIADSTHASSSEELLRNAEAATHEAKRRGRNRWVIFEPGIYERGSEIFDIENELRRALIHGELCLYYQPVAAFEDGSIIGYEALSRWQHPTRGLLTPAAFLDVAEDSGLIIAMDRWVLDAACQQLAAWTSEHSLEDAYVSVNLSGALLASSELAEALSSSLRRHQVDPGRLMLELGASACRRGADALDRALAELGSAGVQLCMDGFGTGHASFALKHGSAFSSVKIDRSLLPADDDDETAWHVIQDLQSIALHLGLRSIVAGVERKEQVEQLRRIGCEHGQGNLFSGPVSPATATGLFNARLAW